MTGLLAARQVESSFVRAPPRLLRFFRTLTLSSLLHETCRWQLYVNGETFCRGGSGGRWGLERGHVTMNSSSCFTTGHQRPARTEQSRIHRRSDRLPSGGEAESTKQELTLCWMTGKLGCVGIGEVTPALQMTLSTHPLRRSSESGRRITWKSETQKQQAD